MVVVVVEFQKKKSSKIEVFCIFPMLLLKYCTLCGETFQWRWSLEIQVVVVTFVVTLSSGVKVEGS